MHVYRVGILTVLMALTSCATRHYERDIFRSTDLTAVDWDHARVAVAVTSQGEISGFEASFAQAFGSGPAFSDQLNVWLRERMGIESTVSFEQLADSDQRADLLATDGLDYVIFVDRWAVLESMRSVQRPPTMGQPYASSKRKRVCHVFIEGGVYDRTGELIYRGEIHGEFVFQYGKTIENACYRASRMFQRLIEDRLTTEQG